MTPGPAVVLALGPREGDLAGSAVPQPDPGLQDLTGSGDGLVDPALISTITGTQVRYSLPAASISSLIMSVTS
ncbi:MAG: hypothetical protein IBX40_07165 [Methanosarcinales archaeon]|nr:hypothetical protein [Methanosarcinales archaeon]